MIVYDEYSPKIKNAYYRFNDYGYVCHMGKLPKNRDWYGYYNIHFPYIHRRYSNLADRLFYHNVCFTKSTESLRLIMHRLSSPDLSAIRNYRYYCTNTCDTELEQKLNEYAANNPDFVRKMIGELGKIYFPIEEAETTGFSKWLYMNANKYFIEHTNNCTGGDRSKCPHCSNNVYSCKNVSYGSDYCPIAKPPEFVAIILCRHCKEPWVDDYCKCLFRSPYSDYPFPAEYPSTFGNTRANGNPNNLYSALHCISNSDQMEWYYRVLVVAEENLDADYKKPEHQIFLAHSGFGCNPKAIGRAVYGMHLSDGEICRRNCDNFVGIMKDEYIPDWARDKMAEAKEILDKKLGEV